MKGLDDNSVDSIVTDPPYGISFMAKKWDYDVPSVEVWKEAMRVLKPGGHALIACGTRTQHRMVVNIEDAGFEIRDVVSWIYGSGFPKSLNISKAIDKAAGAEREKVEATGSLHKNTNLNDDGWSKIGSDKPLMDSNTPATEAAKQWDGWGTALKPACEFFTLCRKPLSEKTIAKNVIKWGTGGINIDGCRVGTETIKTCAKKEMYGSSSRATDQEQGYRPRKTDTRVCPESTHQGRFPANLIHDGSQEVLDLFPETKSAGRARAGGKSEQGGEGGLLGVGNHTGNGMRYGDNGGSAARFFYCPKASKKDRNEGCEELEEVPLYTKTGDTRPCNQGDSPTSIGSTVGKARNNHPTVKPTALMAYLCRLITPTGGVVLDPYMGSGSTGKAAVSEGFSFTGIELDPDYYEICKARIPTT
jgi:site-specific DNA-methyltransferase (adenine-specific)